MAHLLGSKFCIDSLRKDVSDLQASVVDVFSRAGPIRLPSWKYPDKMSCDLDMTEIFDTYNYTDDEEESQVSHIVLLEMVIDRHVLLIQAMGKFLDQLFSMNRINSAHGERSNVSVGLTVKKFWNKMIHLYSTINKNQSQVKEKDRELEELKKYASQLEEENQRLKQGGLMVDEGSVLPPPSTVPISPRIAKECSFKSSQTNETAFVPCDACFQVQRNLRHIGDCLIKICQCQDIPSTLINTKKQFEDMEWLTANDVTYWCSEQSKDLGKINKHLSYLMSTIQPLKQSLAESKSEGLMLQQKVRDLNAQLEMEKQTLTSQMKLYEHKVIDIERLAVQSVDDIKGLNRKLEHDNKELKKTIDVLKAEVALREENVFKLEEEAKQLKIDVTEAVTNSEVVKKLEDDFRETQDQLEDQLAKMKLHSKELAKEQAKSRGLSKQQQALQSKQDSLLQRINTLDEENEVLKSQVAELEDNKEALEDSVDQGRKYSSDVQRDLSEQQKTIQKLQSQKEELQDNLGELEDRVVSVQGQLDQAKERERLIVEYPDLNGPVNPNLTGTGDIAVDMDNQVKANEVRIQILEDQNASLRKSITKILAAQTKHQHTKSIEPIPLWQNYELNGRGDDQPREPHKPQSASGKSVNKLRVSSAKPSSSTSSQRNTSGISAYLQLKKSGLLQAKNYNKGKTGRQSSTSEYSPQDMYACRNCDKMYSTVEDLELHRSYCYGGM